MTEWDWRLLDPAEGRVPTGSNTQYLQSGCRNTPVMQPTRRDHIGVLLSGLSRLSGETGGRRWRRFLSFCMGNSRQCVHMAHCLTKASTCHWVNVVLALEGPGMYVCYGGGHWGGSPSFKQSREKKKGRRGLCKLNGFFTLGAVLTLCLTGGVNSPVLWAKKESVHSARQSDTVWLHDRLANLQSDMDLGRTEHTARRALHSDTPLWSSM